MNTKRKIIFSILIIFVLCLSASAIYAADDSDAKIADSQDDDAISASDIEIETETADDDVGELSSPAESEILSEDKIDTSDIDVEVVNGTEQRSGQVILDFSDIYDSEYSIYSEDTYLTINDETIYGDNEYYDQDLDDYISYKYVFNMPELDLGSHDFTIHYGGNDYYAANTFTGTYYVNEVQKIDTSTARVEVINGTKLNQGIVLIDFEDMYDDDYALYSEDTYLTINGETIYGEEWDDFDWSKKNRYLFRMPELNEGNYEFSIHYGGNSYYTPSDFTGTFYVTKIPLYVGINPYSAKEGSNGNIEVCIYDYVHYINSDDGEPWLSYDITDATLIVNNKEYKFNVQAANYIDEGTFVTIDSLPAGNYSISFKFAGDENYMAVEEFVADEKFSVISKDNKANIKDIYTTATNAYKGNNLTIDYEIYGKIDGIEMNGKIKIILVDENENE